MADILVLLIVLVIMVFAARGAVKHLKGEGPCCGGGGGTAGTEEKVLDKPKLGEKIVKISGMHCEHCVANVTSAINKIDGATAKVNLKKGQAIVSYDRDISTSEIEDAVKKAGYEVVAIH